MEIKIQAANKFLDNLELGVERVIGDQYDLNLETKEKILDLFKTFEIIESGNDVFKWFDKIPIRKNVRAFRCVPGAIIRRGAYIATDAVIMPSFVNIGAHVGVKTMIDSYVTVGSCAYIGARCHVSSSTVIAGVLEPIAAMPVIIEDDVFIGAQCLVSEGMRIKKGAVLASGVQLTGSTKIIDRATGQQYDHIPEYALVVPGFYESAINGESHRALIQCAWIVKYTNHQERATTSINELLRA